MVLFPNAKINIGLYITKKRADGFHELESAFFPTQWTDILEISPHEEFGFSSSGLAISGDLSTNLCVKAFELMKAQYHVPNVLIHLHKIIPMGAGLGGGSADAAYTLMGLRDLFELPLSNDELVPLAQQLGSDCAFFLSPNAQFGVGKGDELSPLAIEIKNYHLLLVYPNFGISTQEAYSNVSISPAPNHLPSALKLPVEEWKHHISNDFEKNIFPVYPVLGEIKDQLYQLGATYAAMSGSGSTLFGLFKELPKTLPDSFANYTVFSY